MSLVKDGNVTIPVFWSMRSPYCYISLDRCLAYQKKYNLTLDLRPVWPIAIRKTSIFHAMEELHYRLPYQNVDSFRSAAFHVFRKPSRDLKCSSTPRRVKSLRDSVMSLPS